MYKTSIKIIAGCAFCVSGLLVTACGSSSNSDERNVAGVWRGEMIETRNTCDGARVITAGAFEHTVNQNEDAVAMQNSAGRQFQGEVEGDDGFIVDGSFQETFDDGTICDANKLIEYDGIDSDSDTTADITVRTVFTCPNNFSCEIISEAAASRQVAAQPTPTPERGDADCRELRERTFTGDSGCGISEVNVIQSSENTVVLDPLGANGASSFSVNSDPETASSTSTDLQVMGAGGYSCSIACPSDITFTLTCFQEGGETCEERF